MSRTAERIARRRSDTWPTGARLPVVAGLPVALAALAFVVALLGWWVSPALADDGSVFTAGGAVHPMANSDIRMHDETVQAVCFGGFAEYRAEFHFVNSGEPQTVLLGFPFSDYSKQFEQPSLVAFRAWQDGVQLPVSIGTGDDPGWPGSEITYYLHEATFPRGETVITVSYLADMNALGSPRFGDDPAARFGPPGMTGSFDYWLHSGAGWSGTIGKAVIRFNLADTFPGWAVDVKPADIQAPEGASLTTKPESYVAIDDRTYQWAFADLEPTTADDIVFAFTIDGDRYFSRDKGSWNNPDVVSIEGSGRVDFPTGWRPAGWEAFDGSAKASWGAPAPGVGSWTKVTFSAPQAIREIRILPGRNETPDTFAQCGRPKALRVTCSDGTDTVLSLKDEPSLQRFAVSADAAWVRFDTLSIYPGLVSNDTYISEIDLGSEPAPGFIAFSDLIGAALTTPAAASAPTVTTVATASTGPVSTATAVPPTTVGPRQGTSKLHGGWLWPAYIAIGVAVAAFVTLVVLERRTRARARR